MLVSEMIARLSQLMAEHGDLECVGDNDEAIEPEFGEGLGDFPNVILFDA